MTVSPTARRRGRQVLVLFFRLVRRANGLDAGDRTGGVRRGHDGDTSGAGGLGTR